MAYGTTRTHISCSSAETKEALPNTQVTWEEKAECFTCRHKRRPENMLTCCVNHEKIGPLSYKQATLVVAFVSMIFDALILVHELVVEGGFDYRNYVAVALCIVWVVVTCLLLLGLHKRANFLLLPWMVFICMLTPLFMIAIVAGTKVIRRCTEDHIPEACTHEYHIFGTKDATAASLRLTLLITILIFNSASIFVVYKYFMILSDQDKDPSKQDTRTRSKDIECGATRYKRFSEGDQDDAETNVLLCEGEIVEESKETVT